MEEPLVSVIMPIYNVEAYLDRAVQSVINQTYICWELILVDDGSTDSSGNRCDEYAGKDKRIKVIHQENKGLGAARNTGVIAAAGKYISFIDSDDWFRDSMLKELVAICENDGVKIACCSFYLAHEGGRIDDFTKQYGKLEVFDQKEALHLLILNMIQSYAWNKMYHRSVFHNVAYPARQHYEDIATTYQLFLNADSIAVYHVPLYYYFQRPGSIMHPVSHDLQIKKYNDLFDAHVQRYLGVKERYPEYSKELLRICEQEAFLLYNSCIHFKHADVKVKRKYSGIAKKYLQSIASSIMADSGISSAHKLRLKLLLSSPLIYRITFLYTYRKRGNLS